MKENIKALASFRIMKVWQSKQDKGLAFLKVKSLDKAVCQRLQKVRSRYWLATAESYVNSDEDIKRIASFNDYFDFHMVSSDAMGQAIQKYCPKAKYLILGAGEYLTDPNIFTLKNEGNRKIDFIASANSFWKLKNFHKVFLMQRALLDKGIKTTSRIVCGSVRDKDYYEEWKSYAKDNFGDDARIVLGSNIDELVSLYNGSRFLVHLSNGDSSPRCIFEALLCGCRCIVSGRWTESLNRWKKSTLVHEIAKDDYEAVLPLLGERTDIKTAQLYGKQIGMKNVWPHVAEYCRVWLDSKFSNEGMFDYSCVGKATFRDRAREYAKELDLLEKML